MENHTSNQETNSTNEELAPSKFKMEKADEDTFNSSYFINLFYSLDSEYFLDQNGLAKVSFKLNGRNVTTKINSPQMKSSIYLFARTWKLKKITPTKIEETINEMSALALESGKVYFCSIRCQRDTNGDVSIQLSKDKYCLISSSGEGYQIVSDSNLKFDWPQKQLDLPLPTKTTWNNLLKLLIQINNFEKEENVYLLLAYILKSLVINSGANPIAVLQGPQGSAKSTSSNNIKKIIDPTLPLLVSPPRCEAEVLITANSSYFLAYDNLSGLNADLADTFCRLSTGGGISKRALYTDDDEKSYNLLKSLLFNGIDEASIRPDFNDRAIIFHLKRIPNEKRVSEEALKERFKKIYPEILGGIYQLLSLVLKELPSIRTEGLPRMTEYARFGIALEKVLKLSDGFFLQIYEENIREKIESNFWSDEVCNAFYCFFYSYENIKLGHHERRPEPAGVNLITGEYFLTGTSEELRLIFSKTKDKSSSVFPKTARGFSEQLKRIEPLLNGKNIRIERDRTSHRREIRVFAKIEPEALKKLLEHEHWKETSNNWP